MVQQYKQHNQHHIFCAGLQQSFFSDWILSWYQSLFFFQMSTTSSTSSKTISTMISTITGLLPTQPFGHLINIKLGHENYLLWKAQMMPYLRSQQLLGFVDGSISAPEKIITMSTESGTAQVPNPAYQTWLQQDQAILSAILSSLTPEVLSQVLLLNTSHEVWIALECRFASQSKARIMNVRRQLVTIQKKGMPYFLFL